MAELWRHIFAPEAYVDVVSPVMLHPDRAVSNSSLWSEGSTVLSVSSVSQKSISERVSKRGMESSPVMQNVDLQMEDVIKPRLEPTSKRKAIDTEISTMEPAHKMEKLAQVSSMSSGGVSTPKSVSFAELADTIGVSETLNKQFQEDDLLRRKDFGKLRPGEVKVEVIPTKTSAEAIGWDKFVEEEKEEAKLELTHEPKESAETLKTMDMLQSEERERRETEAIFEFESRGGKVATPSPAGEYSLTDLSSDIQVKLAKYFEPGAPVEPSPETKEPSLVGIQTPREAKLRPTKFGKQERRPSLMAVPDVIKINLPPLDEDFNKVAVVVPTEEEERMEISVPVKEIKRTVSKGEAVQVPVMAEIGDKRVEVEARASPVQITEEKATDEWNIVGKTARPSIVEEQAGGVEIAIPLQNAFETLQEQEPTERVEIAEPKVKEQQVPSKLAIKGRKKARKAKKERIYKLTQGKPLLEERPEVSVHEVKLPTEKQSMIVIESKPSAELLKEESVGVEERHEPTIIAKSQGPSGEWTTIGKAEVKILGEPGTKKLEILLPTENVFGVLEEQKESEREKEPPITSLPEPIAPRGQPHKTERERSLRVPVLDKFVKKHEPPIEIDEKEKELRQSIIMSPVSPLKVETTGGQPIVLKSIPSSIGIVKEGEVSRPVKPQIQRMVAPEALRTRRLRPARPIIGGELERIMAAENHKIVDSVNDNLQQFKNEFADHMERLVNDLESRNKELSQQLTNVLDQLTGLQQIIKEFQKARPGIEEVKEQPVAEISVKSKGEVLTPPHDQPTEFSLSSLYSEKIGLCNPPSVNLDYFEPSLFETTETVTKPIIQEGVGKVAPKVKKQEGPAKVSPIQVRAAITHPSVDLTHFDPTLFASPIMRERVRHPSVNLEYFEPTLFSTPTVAKPSVVHPSIDLTFFEPELFATPDAFKKAAMQPKKTKTPKKKSLLSKISARLKGLVSAPAVPEKEKHDERVSEVAPEKEAMPSPTELQRLEPSPLASPKRAVTEPEKKVGERTKQPSVDLQYFEPKLFAPSPTRHPSIDLAYFEPSLFATPKIERISKESRQRHPSIDLTYFEPSMFATPRIERVTKESRQRHPSIDLTYFEPSMFVTPKIERVSKESRQRHPSIDLTYFEPSLFATPKVERVSKESRQRHPSIDLTYFEPSMFATPVSIKPSKAKKQELPKGQADKTGFVRSRVKAMEQKATSPAVQPPTIATHEKPKIKKRHPSVDLTYFDPSLFSLPETGGPIQSAKAKKKRNWLKRMIDKLFKHKKSEKSLEKERAKKEAKAAKKEMKEQRKEEKKRLKEAKQAEKAAKKESKASKSPAVIQLEPIEAPTTKLQTHPSIDLTFFEPSLFATPPPRASPSERRNVTPIAMATPPQKPYIHFARPVMIQQPSQPLSGHDYNVHRLRQPSKIESRRPSVDLQFFEPSLFEEAPEFKPPQAKEKSPLMVGMDEMTVPKDDSIWSILLDGTITPDLKQQARELILDGNGIPEEIRPSLWLTLSGGAPKHTIAYRRLSRQSEPIKDNLFAMVKRLSSALDSYYKSLSGHSFEYSLEPFVIQLVTRTVKLPNSVAPIDSAILYQEEQTFALALNLLFGPKYHLSAVFTKHGLREWCYELDRILEHEDNVMHPSSMTFAAPWFQGLFFSEVNDNELSLILDWFILEGRSVLFRLAVAMESNRQGLFDIARDLGHINNTQLDHLHNSFESTWEHKKVQLHHDHKERTEVSHEFDVLHSLSSFDEEMQRLYQTQHQLRNKLDHERDQRTTLEHANENLIYKLYEKDTGKSPQL